MINNEQFISECKKDKVIYREYIVMNDTEVDVNAKMYQTAYKDTTFFGKFNLNYIKFTTPNDIKYRNKDFYYYKEVNGVNQLIGHYYVTEVVDSDTDEEVQVTAFDDGIKFANKYTTSLQYGRATLYDVLQECCTNCGIVLKNESITNGDFIVENNQFEENAQYGDVIAAVAQISGNFAFINNMGQLELKFFEDTEEIIEQYVQLEDKRDTQPITIVRIGLSDVEGEYVERRDEDLIEQYGENYLILNDNPFAYSELKRNQLIDAIFNKVKGFGYSAFTSKECFAPYFELGDGIRFRNKNGDLVSSVILRIETNNQDVTLSAPSITNAEVAYNQPESDDSRLKRTELSVDKANQQIQGIITNVGENTTNISSLTQTVNGFDARITEASTKSDNATNKVAELSMDVSSLRSEIGEVTDTTVHQTGYGLLKFENINQSYPVKVIIHAMADSDIAYLYPSSSLFPGSNLFTKDRILRFTNTTTNEVWNYRLPANLRYYNSTTYDEFMMDFATGGDTSVCQVTKKVGINEDRSKYALTTPKTTQYSFPVELALTDGNYTVELMGYPNAYLDVTLMSKNMYTSQYATKVEMNSKITQKADEITTEVSRTYETIDNVAELATRVTQTEEDITSEVTNRTQKDTELSSRITQNANSITSEVTNRQNGDNALSSRITQNANNIESKVSKGSIISTINQSAESVQINANKISLAGKEINMTSDNIAINSTNFKVDKNGNVTANSFNSNNATITGGLLHLKSGTTNNPDFIVGNSRRDGCWIVPRQIGILSGDNERITANAVSGGGVNFEMYSSSKNSSIHFNLLNYGGDADFFVDDVYCQNNIHALHYLYDSKEEIKKDIEQYKERALDIINNTDVYEFNYKNVSNQKKTIGFVIGDNYNTANEIISDKKDGINSYSVMGILWKAVQEQQEEIEELNKEIKKMKGES